MSLPPSLGEGVNVGVKLNPCFNQLRKTAYRSRPCGIRLANPSAAMNAPARERCEVAVNTGVGSKAGTMNGKAKYTPLKNAANNPSPIKTVAWILFLLGRMRTNQANPRSAPARSKLATPVPHSTGPRLKVCDAVCVYRCRVTAAFGKEFLSRFVDRFR